MEYFTNYKKEIYYKTPKYIEGSRNSKLKNKFGITSTDYDEVYKKQNGVCAVCKKPETIKGKRLSVDHNHKTGQIRGLLCNHCNIALGQIKDNIETLSKMIDYLNN